MDKIIQKWKNANLKNYIQRNPNDIIRESDLSSVERWLKSDEATRHRKRVHKLSVPDAIRLALKWESKKTSKKLLNQEDKGSSLVRSYPSNFSWVKLNTNESMSYESALMDHCLYRNYTHRTDCIIFSLRDNSNYPICTVEFNKDGSLIQFKGKKNRDVESKYNYYLIDFFIKNPIMPIKKTCKEIISLGYCYSMGNPYPLNNLADEMRVHHDIRLYDNELDKLSCKKLIIWGNLNLKDLPNLEELPHHLIIYGDLNITNCPKLKKISKILQVSGTISIDGCMKIKEFPIFLICKRLQLTNCGIIHWNLFKNIRIQTHISCFNTKLSSEFAHQFKLVNNTGTWQTYEMKLKNSVIEVLKYYFNSSKKIFDLFSHR